MSYPLISKIKSLSIPLKAYGPGNISNIFTDQAYYSISDKSDPIGTQPTFFIIEFPYTPFYIEKVKITVGRDVFPIHWSILLSNDNETYETIHESSEHLCKTEYQTNYYSRSKRCIVRDSNTFQIDTTKQKFVSRFLKFQLIENSYKESYNQIYTKLILFQSFEVFGRFYIEYPITHKHITLKHNFLFVFFFLC